MSLRLVQARHLVPQAQTPLRFRNVSLHGEYSLASVPQIYAPESLTNDPEAVNIREPHPSGIKKLQAYAAQLAWLGGKFPIDICADFTWYPALGYNTERPMVRNNVKYELMNVLYNLAALYSQLAATNPRANPEGLKVAAHNFNLAAGVLSHLQTEVLPELRMSDPPEDMDIHTLEALTYLFLAQSQECSWQRGVMNGLKELSIAKLAARVSDLYNMAAEAAVRSNAIRSAWIHHMTVKHHYFAAAAQFRAACDCLEKRKYGEEVARLRDAVACITEGLKEKKGGYINKLVVDDLNGLKRKAEDDLKRAEKDNDMIFLNPVPPKSDLKVLDRFNIAKVKIPSIVANPFDFLGEKTEFGPALSRLVPFSVHMAISIYEERRDRMVNQSIIQELDTLSRKVHTFLSSIGMPDSLQALEKPLGLPPSLVQHAEELRQGDAIGRVHKSFEDIDKLRSTDLAFFETGKVTLMAERDEDERLRKKHGTERWTLLNSLNDPQGAKLWSHANEIEGYFQSSASSDSVVREKFAASENLLRILCGPDSRLMEFVLSSLQRDTSDDMKPAVTKLCSAYNDVLRFESRRRKKVEKLKETLRRDDIKLDILKEAARLERQYPTTAIVPAHFEDFFEKRLDRLYEPELLSIEAETQEQERVLAHVDQVHHEFEAQRRKVGDRGLHEREQALQKLESAYFKYKEVVNHLEVGRKFYNDLSKIVGQGLRDVAQAWVAERQMNARALDEELSLPPLATLNLSHDHSPLHPTTTMPYNSKQQPYVNPDARLPQKVAPLQKLAQSSAEVAIQTWAAGEVQKPQPVPPPPSSDGNSIWNPVMGINFSRGPDPAEEHRQVQRKGGSRNNTWDPSGRH